MSAPTAIIPKSMEAVYERFHYSPAVRAGNVLYMAGQVGRDEDLNVIADPRAQYERAFENVREVLEAAGASPSNVVELTSYHTTLEDFPMFLELKNSFFSTEPYPTWSVIGVAALAMEGLRVELKCTAVLPD